MSTAVLVEGVSKQYRLGTLSGTTALADLRRWWRRVRGGPASTRAPISGNARQLLSIEKEIDVRRPEEYIWALRDVSFRVPQGEAVGIIGRNGAGKSTLLKILSRVTAPTTGEIKAKGRISSLLEVGTGFHPELTGRENTFLNGAILGMSQAEVRRKFDEIVEFSGVERFIDTPVKRYSSGMYVRLAFAVAAHLEPEILVVDEVLAVGDTAFQKKCLGKMGDVAQAGRTVLFVSHNMSAVADLCSSAFWLEKGQVVETGSARTVVAAYLSKFTEPRTQRSWNEPQAAPGNENVRLLHASVQAADGDETEHWTIGTSLRLTFRVLNFRPDLPMHSEILAYTKEGTCVFQSASAWQRQEFGIVESLVTIPGNLLNDDTYSIVFSTHLQGVPGLVAEGVLSFEINDVSRDISPGIKWPGSHATGLGVGNEASGSADYRGGRDASVMKVIKEGLLRVRWWMYHLNRRQLYRWFYKVVRPGSDPYISGDGFRQLARHVYDETNQSLRPGAVRNGDVVFVSTEYVYRFFKELEPGIRSNYRLITHNSDVPADEAMVQLASDRTEIWFALNNTQEHEKVVPIPIGLENVHHYYAGVPAEFDAVRTLTRTKKPRILSGFTIATNPDERQHVHDLAAKAPCVDQIPVRLSQAEYLRTLALYKFLVCPPGNGLDTHRTWEAMYLRVIPIVKDSVPTRAFERQGLPLWILHRWESLLDLSEADLEIKYAELESRFSAPALWMDYWKRRISQPQDPNEPCRPLVLGQGSRQSQREPR